MQGIQNNFKTQIIIPQPQHITHLQHSTCSDIFQVVKKAFQDLIAYFVRLCSCSRQNSTQLQDRAQPSNTNPNNPTIAPPNVIQVPQQNQPPAPVQGDQPPANQVGQPLAPVQGGQLHGNQPLAPVQGDQPPAQVQPVNLAEIQARLLVADQTLLQLLTPIVPLLEQNAQGLAQRIVGGGVQLQPPLAAAVQAAQLSSQALRIAVQELERRDPGALEALRPAFAAAGESFSGIFRGLPEERQPQARPLQMTFEAMFQQIERLLAAEVRSRQARANLAQAAVLEVQPEALVAAQVRIELAFTEAETEQRTLARLMRNFGQENPVAQLNQAIQQIFNPLIPQIEEVAQRLVPELRQRVQEMNLRELEPAAQALVQANQELARAVREAPAAVAPAFTAVRGAFTAIVEAFPEFWRPRVRAILDAPRFAPIATYLEADARARAAVAEIEAAGAMAEGAGQERFAQAQVRVLQAFQEVEQLGRGLIVREAPNQAPGAGGVPAPVQNAQHLPIARPIPAAQPPANAPEPVLDNIMFDLFPFIERRPNAGNALVLADLWDRMEWAVMARIPLNGWRPAGAQQQPAPVAGQHPAAQPQPAVIGADRANPEAPFNQAIQQILTPLIPQINQVAQQLVQGLRQRAPAMEPVAQALELANQELARAVREEPARVAPAFTAARAALTAVVEGYPEAIRGQVQRVLARFEPRLVPITRYLEADGRARQAIRDVAEAEIAPGGAAPGRLEEAQGHRQQVFNELEDLRRGLGQAPNPAPDQNAQARPVDEVPAAQPQPAVVDADLANPEAPLNLAIQQILTPLIPQIQQVARQLVQGIRQRAPAMEPAAQALQLANRELARIVREEPAVVTPAFTAVRAALTAVVEAYPEDIRGLVRRVLTRLEEPRLALITRYLEADGRARQAIRDVAAIEAEIAPGGAAPGRLEEAQVRRQQALNELEDLRRVGGQAPNPAPAQNALPVPAEGGIPAAQP